jgi:Uma2 family endonuclease
MRTPTLLTEAEFLALPDYPGKQELLDGELLQLPPAKKSHSDVAAILMKRLETVWHQSQVYIEVAYQIDRRQWLIPDASIPWEGQLIKDDWFQDSPMLAIEIVSRGNTERELERKIRLYLENGGEEVWILYPKTRLMTIWNPNGLREVSEGEIYDCELLNCNIAADFWIAPVA